MNFQNKYRPKLVLEILSETQGQKLEKSARSFQVGPISILAIPIQTYLL